MSETTLAERAEREVKALKALFSRNPILAVALLIVIAVPIWHTYFREGLNPPPTPSDLQPVTTAPAPPKVVMSDAREGNPETLNRQIPPDLSLAKATHAQSINEFKVKGGASIRKATDFAPGYFEVVATSLDEKSNYSVEFANDVKPHFFLSVNIGGDKNIGTLELQGIGPENENIHFIVDNHHHKFFLWAGEKNQRAWKILPVEKEPNSNTLGMYQDGRYVVLFLNDKRVASFDTRMAQRTGKVGVAFKRQRYAAPGYPLTDAGKDAIAFFNSFSVYQFE